MQFCAGAIALQQVQLTLSRRYLRACRTFTQVSFRTRLTHTKPPQLMRPQECRSSLPHMFQPTEKLAWSWSEHACKSFSEVDLPSNTVVLCRLVEGLSLCHWPKIHGSQVSLAENEAKVKRIAVQLLEVRLMQLTQVLAYVWCFALT